MESAIERTAVARPNCSPDSHSPTVSPNRLRVVIGSFRDESLAHTVSSLTFLPIPIPLAPSLFPFPSSNLHAKCSTWVFWR
jgi:hypothetical protein